MSQERSVHVSGKRRSVAVRAGALAALAAAGATLVRAGHENAARRVTVREPSPVAAAAPSMTRAPTALLAPSDSHREHGAYRTAAPPAHGESPRSAAPRPASEERARLVVAAHRELEQLELQEPTNFLAVFDMMREEGQGDDETLEAGKSATHAYILARMHILESMLRRFIDDPESDQGLQSDALLRLDADFARTVEALSRDVPAMASVQEILTTTSLKAPAFADTATTE